MGIDAELYFGTADVEDALEKEIERVSKKEDAITICEWEAEKRRKQESEKLTAKEQYHTESRYRFEPTISNIVYDSSEDALAAAKEQLREYTVIVNDKTNKPIDKLFKDDYEAMKYILDK